MPVIDPPIELRPCPFCRCAELELMMQRNGRSYRAWVQCGGKDCGAFGPVAESLEPHEEGHVARAACRAWNMAERAA